MSVQPSPADIPLERAAGLHRTAEGLRGALSLTCPSHVEHLTLAVPLER